MPLDRDQSCSSLTELYYTNLPYKPLHSGQKCVIIHPYSGYGKEVYRACYDRYNRGILHTGAGCRDIATETGQCNQDATPWRDAWLQGWGNLAHQQRGICTVHEDSEKRLPTQKGKLTSLSAAQRQSPITVQALSDYLSPCYFMLILPQIVTNRNISQQEQWSSHDTSLLRKADEHE